MEPLNTLPKYNLFGIETQDYDKSRIVVLPIPYDSTVTYKTGTREGPRAIIEASRNIELYSYELGRDISKEGIFTTDEMAPDLSSPENMIKNISKEVEIILGKGKTPVLLGGEHSITLGAISAFHNLHKEISIVQFDAHSDSRKEIFGSKYTHASVMARASEMYENIVQVGIRSIDSQSMSRIDRSRLMFMEDIEQSGTNGVIDAIDQLTGKDVYVTIDLDVLDPSEMPSVGTPEPGGIRFKELVSILRGVYTRKNIVGMDIVELSPIPYLTAPNYLAAKLAYLAIGFMLKEEIE